MRFKIFNLKFIICIIAFSFLPCSDLSAGSLWQDPAVKKTLERIPRLDAYKALALFKSGKLIIIDTHEHMKKGQKSPIVGALAIPYPKMEKVKLKIPKNRVIACFCH